MKIIRHLPLLSLCCLHFLKFSPGIPSFSTRIVLHQCSCHLGFCSITLAHNSLSCCDIIHMHYPFCSQSHGNTYPHFDVPYLVLAHPLSFHHFPRHRCTCFSVHICSFVIHFVCSLGFPSGLAPLELFAFRLSLAF